MVLGLTSHPTIVTTTPSEFLATNPDLPAIDTIGTGSWIDGTLRTWAGEQKKALVGKGPETRQPGCLWGR